MSEDFRRLPELHRDIAGMRAGARPAASGRPRGGGAEANTVAPVSKTGFSARAVQVRLVNWLRVDIANCSLN